LTKYPGKFTRSLVVNWMVSINLLKISFTA